MIGLHIQRPSQYAHFECIHCVKQPGFARVTDSAVQKSTVTSAQRHILALLLCSVDATFLHSSD